MPRNSNNVNTKYLTSNRGIIKTIQIILGFVVCSLLCYRWYGGRSCFGEGRLGFASTLNFIFLIINITLFVLHFINVVVYKFEKIICVAGVILFLVATGLLIWFMVEQHIETDRLIGATVLLGIQFILFLYDVRILDGEYSSLSL